MTNKEQPPSTPSKKTNERFKQRLKQLYCRIMPIQRAESKEDVLANLRQAESDGIVARDAYDMMQRVMYVSDLRVRDIMIPSSKIVLVDKDDDLEKCLDILVESSHSRFPVLDPEKDQIIGILLAKDLLRFFDEDNKQAFNLRDLLRPAVFVPESKRLNILLKEFRSNRNHMAVVVNEYGNIAGLVTIEDVLEQIVGDIEDEHDIDEEESMIRTLHDGECIIKAILPIDEFNQHFKTYLHDENSDTIGGLIAQKMGHVPQRGESVDIEKIIFEIVHADSRRVHLIRVKK